MLIAITKPTEQWLTDIAQNIENKALRDEYMNLYISHIFQELKPILATTEEELETLPYEQRIEQEAEFLIRCHLDGANRVQERRVANRQKSRAIGEQKRHYSHLSEGRAQELRQTLMSHPPKKDDATSTEVIKVEALPSRRRGEPVSSQWTALWDQRWERETIPLKREQTPEDENEQTQGKESIGTSDTESSGTEEEKEDGKRREPSQASEEKDRPQEADAEDEEKRQDKRGEPIEIEQEVEPTPPREPVQ